MVKPFKCIIIYMFYIFFKTLGEYFFLPFGQTNQDLFFFFWTYWLRIIVHTLVNIDTFILFGSSDVNKMYSKFLNHLQFQNFFSPFANVVHLSFFVFLGLNQSNEQNTVTYVLFNQYNCDRMSGWPWILILIYETSRPIILEINRLI